MNAKLDLLRCIKETLASISTIVFLFCIVYEEESFEKIFQADV